MKKALLMCCANLENNPRPRRVLETLNQLNIKTDLVAYSCGDDMKIDDLFVIKPTFYGYRVRLLIRTLAFMPISTKSKDTIRDHFYKLSGLEEVLNQQDYDLIFVEDIYLLSLAFRIRKNARLVFDAREYYPKQNEDNLKFRYIESPERVRLCRTYLPKCDEVITVSPGLAQAYYQNFGVVSHLVMSTPRYHDLQPRKTNPSHFRMVHHGGAGRNRQIENMIEIVKQLDERFTLDLYLVNNDEYIEFLREKATGCDRIRFHKPVPFEQIIPMLTNYDIGFFYVEPTTFNLHCCLPNKLFEFIQARLLVAIGPSPDMAAIVKQYNCGVVADSFSIHAMVQALANLNADLIDQAKENSHRAAKELCFEEEQKKLINVILK